MNKKSLHPSNTEHHFLPVREISTNNFSVLFFTTYICCSSIFTFGTKCFEPVQNFLNQFKFFEPVQIFQPKSIC